MPHKLACWVLWVLLLAGCRSAPDWVHPFGAANSLAGSIYDVREERFISERRLAAALGEADFVLLGESHDNLDHHRLQAHLVETLGRRRGRLAAVAFEMIETTQQPVLVEYLQARPRELAGLGQALVWEQRGWPPFEAYRPIIAAALRSGAEIVAAGLPGKVAGEVVARGFEALPASFVRRTGLSLSLPPGVAAALQQEIAAVHCEDVPGELIRRLARARRAADASLADRLTTVTGRGQGVLIAGAAHVRKDWGVPWYLAHLRPEGRTASLAFVEVGLSARVAPASLAYDYVWFTPAAHPPGQNRGRQPGGPTDQLDTRRGGRSAARSFS